MSIGLKYKDDELIFREVEGRTPYLEYPLFKETGVSTGCWSSLNLSFTRGDNREHVMENYNRIAEAIGVSTENMVFSKQTHTTNVRVMTEDERGNGITRPQKYEDVDGMVTNVPGLCLVTFYADCVPLYFVDPVKKAIGLSHSGWRGTVGKIGLKTVEKMTAEYGSNPADILAAVGPSICQECYEVSEEVAEEFKKNYDSQYWNQLFYLKENGHYQLDLWKANELVFAEAGIKPEHMAITNVCTHCNSDILYSHRRTGDKRGNLAAFLALRKEADR